MGEGRPVQSVEVLLERARHGDPEAQQELFRVAQQRASEWAKQRLRGGQLGLSRPSDIAQDTSMLAYTGFGSFKGTTEAEWESWLRVVLRNCIAQSRRAARQKKRDERKTVPLEISEVARTRSGQQSPSEVAATQEHWRLLMGYIFDLPRDQKDAIVLVHLQQLPIAEVARRMGKSEAAMGGLLQRGLATLRVHVTGERPVRSSRRVAHEEAAAAWLVYLRRCEDEGQVDAASFIAEYASCASELREMIDWSLQIRALRPERRQV